MSNSDVQTIFDADNHYWEPSDAFTRHRDPKFAERGLRVVEADGKHKYYFGDRPHPILPGPATSTAAHGRARCSSTSPARRQGRRRRRAVVRGPGGPSGVVQPGRPAEGDGRPGCGGRLAVPLPRRVHRGSAVAQAWGYVGAQHTGDTTALTLFEPFIQMVMKHRLVHDFAGALMAHHLFERLPGLRIAYIENGADWVGPLLHGLHLMAAQHPGMFKTPPVDQFIEHCWVAPFVEDKVEDLAAHLPVERILFGSDWPHAEGMAHPRDFLANVASFSPRDQRRIMAENARELTFR